MEQLQEHRHITLECAREEVLQGLKALIEFKQQEAILKEKQINDSPVLQVLFNMSKSFTDDAKIKKWLINLVDAVKTLPETGVVSFKDLNKKDGVLQKAGQVSVREYFEDFIGRGGEKSKQEIIAFMKETILPKFLEGEALGRVVQNPSQLMNEKLRQDRPCDILMTDYIARFQASQGKVALGKCEMQNGRINMLKTEQTSSEELRKLFLALSPLESEGMILGLSQHLSTTKERHVETKGPGACVESPDFAGKGGRGLWCC